VVAPKHHPYAFPKWSRRNSHGESIPTRWLLGVDARRQRRRLRTFL